MLVILPHSMKIKYPKIDKLWTTKKLQFCSKLYHLAWMPEVVYMFVLMRLLRGVSQPVPCIVEVPHQKWNVHFDNICLKQYGKAIAAWFALFFVWHIDSNCTRPECFDTRSGDVTAVAAHLEQGFAFDSSRHQLQTILAWSVCMLPDWTSFVSCTTRLCSTVWWVPMRQASCSSPMHILMQRWQLTTWRLTCDNLVCNNWTIAVVSD